MALLKKHSKILLYGLLISFIGSLPVGSLNLTACKVSVSGGANAALVFFMGVILVELLLVWGTLKGLTNMRFHKGQVVLFQIVGMVLLVYLAIDNFNATEFAGHSPGGSIQGLGSMQKSPFVLGILLSTVNPLQVPFWVGWNGFLLERKLLNHSPLATFAYLTGIGWGTLFGMALFVGLGTYFIDFLGAYAYVFSILLSAFYIGVALYLASLIYKNYLKPMFKTHV